MKDIILKISNDFSFSYGSNKIFDSNINIVLKKGIIYGIYGRNGIGKTTFLNILNTFVHPTTGSLEYFFKKESFIFNKNSITECSRIISNNIRRCFQTPLLIDELSILDNIIITKREYQNERYIDTFCRKKHTIYSEILKLLDLLKINANDKAEILSYGQRRIISNLQIIYSNPQLILLDEPFVGLHASVIKLFKEEYLRKVSLGATIIIVEHLSENLKNFVNEYILIDRKKLTLKKDYVVNI